MQRNKLYPERQLFLLTSENFPGINMLKVAKKVHIKSFSLIYVKISSLYHLNNLLRAREDPRRFVFMMKPTIYSRVSRINDTVYVKMIFKMTLLFKMTLKRFFA